MYMDGTSTQTSLHIFYFFEPAGACLSAFIPVYMLLCKFWLFCIIQCLILSTVLKPEMLFGYMYTNWFCMICYLILSTTLIIICFLDICKLGGNFSRTMFLSLGLTLVRVKLLFEGAICCQDHIVIHSRLLLSCILVLHVHLWSIIRGPRFSRIKKKLDALACNSALKNNMLCKNTAYIAVHAAVSGCLICRVVDIWLLNFHYLCYACWPCSTYFWS